ncbi:MAG: LpxL/LpxP family Kdo(2)-lipid IV(A) lauroyl/palmitoleoyl acyltransferase, partial [Gammaproteobacteria bacterium]|nr:LpxL/LpxP family Kdo(2)-lipid IV(A) lauroyl/palmitoleoyl acyltransferase [Gammaproteobacteria bacterium]
SPFSPRYWPTWLGIGFMWLIVKLPMRLQLVAGRMLGRLFKLLSSYRHTIARTNIGLCFPELDVRQQQQLVNRFYESLGMSLVETAFAFWADDRDFNRFGTLEGLEHIETARKQGNGVLLLSGHFCSLDFAGRILVKHHPVCFTYQKLRNRLIDSAIKRKRAQGSEILINRYDTRGFIKALKAGHVVWYAPDQDQARKNSVFAPFFGIPANTLTSTTKLVKLTSAVVLPFHIRRLPDSKGYALKISPPLENFPGASEVEDATRFNAILEAQVREHPEQYLWLHRRFKTRPVKGDKLYPQKPRRIRRKQRKLRKKNKGLT